MPQNNEALDVMHSLAQKEGYKGDKDQLLNLLSNDKEALDTMYSLAKKEGYNKDINSFQELIGVKKNTGSSGSATGLEGFSKTLAQNEYTISTKDEYSIHKTPKKLTKVGKEVPLEYNLSPSQKESKVFSGEQGAKNEQFLNNVTNFVVNRTTNPEFKVQEDVQGGFKRKDVTLNAPEDTRDFEAKVLSNLGDGVLLATYTIANGLNETASLINKHGAQGYDIIRDKIASKINEAESNISKTNQNAGYNGSPTEAFKKGDYASVLELSVLGGASSIPISAALANPIVGATWAVGNVSKEYRDLKAQGYNDDDALNHAVISTGTEFVVDKLFGGAKQLNTLFKSSGKEAVKATVKKSIGKELIKSMGENSAGEVVEQLTNNLSEKYVLGNRDKNIFDGVGDSFFTALATSHAYAPLVALNTINNNKQLQDALQKQSTSSENAYPGETGQNQPQDNTGVRPSQQGAEVTQEGSQEEVKQTPSVEVTQQDADGVVQSLIESQTPINIQGQDVVITNQDETNVELNGQEVVSKEILSDATVNGEPLVDVIQNVTQEKQDIVNENQVSDVQPTSTPDITQTKSGFDTINETNSAIAYQNIQDVINGKQAKLSSKNKNTFVNSQYADVIRNLDNIAEQLGYKKDC